jgi:hypothetical protein
VTRDVVVDLERAEPPCARVLAAQDITKRTRQAQGLPPLVEDAVALRRIADMLTAASS